ncbi:alpha/beta fold hydrolase [Mesorhizobium sp. J428]|uniref:alpha/beta fold hydrolase n=1 Tax=Mesorhizobium sp. J428 TaxID=2898440 RepID=UPI0021514002|nr:alpha/beta hydrolase [Mesorhizobium sp. J428]MCR5859045.1 alpha/beta hydrolase [Mesorhizobium sp. J428]
MKQAGYEDFHYSSTDGLKLYARIYGERNPSALPAICLAGLTRNAADFHDLALYLARHPKTPRQVVAFDYRGRGRSAYDRDWQNYNVVIESGDILAGLAAMGIEHGGFIGTSRGGLIIHVLAAMRPAVLKAVVFNDIGPVVEGAALAQIRAYLERAPKPRTFAEAVEISRAAQKDNFPALTDADWERMARAFYREENGTLVADFDPALLNTMSSIDLNKPLPQMWPQFEGLRGIPVLAIRGENSKLLSAETLEEMARRHPAMETITVEGQGHAPLLETGDLPERIARFLEKAERS